MPTDAVKLLDQPVSLWLVRMSGNDSTFGLADLYKLNPSLIDYVFRGVSISRLGTILRMGIDVEPSDSVIYVGDSFDKAWEYGGMPKVIVALSPDCLEMTCWEVSANAPKDELASLRARFPTELRSSDGEKVWFSRLNPDDQKISTSYELAYARWIPGDPFEALRAVLIFARPDDEAEILADLWRSVIF